MTIKPYMFSQSQQSWTNVAVAILKGAAKNETLRTLQLVVPEPPYPVPETPYPVPELVDEVRRSNPKLQLTVQAGPRSESDHVTVGMTVAWVEGLYSTPHGTKWGCLKFTCNGSSFRHTLHMFYNQWLICHSLICMHCSQCIILYNILFTNVLCIGYNYLWFVFLQGWGLSDCCDWSYSCRWPYSLVR